jgi:DegV family protein with EDD domain
MNEIAIVTDSTADLPSEEVIKYEIQVIPNLIIIEGKNLRDGIDISREEFYNQLPKMSSQPTTSTASSGTFHKTYEKLLSQGAKYILSIHPPVGLSGIINAASAAAHAFEDHIRIIDSKQVSAGLGFQVLAAAEAIQAGTGLVAIINLLRDMQKRIKVVAMLDTLEYIRRSGRVSWARARLGNILQVKPFIELSNGIVSSLGETRSRTKGIQQLKKYLFQLGALERLAILHTNAEIEAYNFIQDIQMSFDFSPLTVNVTTAIGTHVGPNAIGFAAVMMQGW